MAARAVGRAAPVPPLRMVPGGPTASVPTRRAAPGRWGGEAPPSRGLRWLSLRKRRVVRWPRGMRRPDGRSLPHLGSAPPPMPLHRSRRTTAGASSPFRALRRPVAGRLRKPAAGRPSRQRRRRQGRRPAPLWRTEAPRRRSRSLFHRQPNPQVPRHRTPPDRLPSEARRTGGTARTRRPQRTRRPPMLKANGRSRHLRRERPTQRRPRPRRPARRLGPRRRNHLRNRDRRHPRRRLPRRRRPTAQRLSSRPGRPSLRPPGLPGRIRSRRRPWPLCTVCMPCRNCPAGLRRPRRPP